MKPFIGASLFRFVGPITTDFINGANTWRAETPIIRTANRSMVLVIMEMMAFPA